jgi:hypothetical protein
MTGCLEGVPGSTSGFYPDDIREPYALVSGPSTAIWELETLARDLHQAVDQKRRDWSTPVLSVTEAGFPYDHRIHLCGSSLRSKHRGRFDGLQRCSSEKTITSHPWAIPP